MLGQLKKRRDREIADLQCRRSLLSYFSKPDSFMRFFVGSFARSSVCPLFRKSVCLNYLFVCEILLRRSLRLLPRCICCSSFNACMRTFADILYHSVSLEGQAMFEKVQENRKSPPLTCGYEVCASPHPLIPHTSIYLDLLFFPFASLHPFPHLPSRLFRFIHVDPPSFFVLSLLTGSFNTVFGSAASPLPSKCARSRALPSSGATS